MTTRENKPKDQRNVLQNITTLKSYFEFITQAAHDIRSPLNVIELLAGVIGQHADEEIKGAFFDSIGRIKKLADEILVQYQIRCNLEHDAPTLIAKDEFTELVKKIIREKKFVLKNKPIHIETNIDLSDPEKYYTVLTKLDHWI